MDYLGKKCPGCDRYFHANDDIVVCPDCGTPQHRECYEKEMRCVNAEKHEEGYSYLDDESAAASQVQICKSCGSENEANAFFCKTCGKSLKSQGNSAYQQQSQQTTGGAAQNQDTPFFVKLTDPLSGVDKDYDLGDGVTAGEAAKYVKQNTPYFIRIFYNIREFNRSKFNFPAALFCGGYLLYRKMYKIGAIITAIQLLMFMVLSYISMSSEYTTLINNLSQLITDNSSLLISPSPELMTFISKLNFFQMFLLFYPVVYEFLHLAMMIVVGCCTNRLYFSHCKEKINRIKASETDSLKAEETLQTKGGVNLALAISLLATYLILNYLPSILSMIH